MEGLEGLGWLCGVRQWVEEIALLETCLYPSSFALTNIVGVTECENIVWMCLLISDVCKTSYSAHPKPHPPVLQQKDTRRVLQVIVLSPGKTRLT